MFFFQTFCHKPDCEFNKNEKIEAKNEKKTKSLEKYQCLYKRTV